MSRNLKRQSRRETKPSRSASAPSISNKQKMQCQKASCQEKGEKRKLPEKHLGRGSKREITEEGNHRKEARKVVLKKNLAGKLEGKSLTPRLRVLGKKSSRHGALTEHVKKEGNEEVNLITWARNAATRWGRIRWKRNKNEKKSSSKFRKQKETHEVRKKKRNEKSLRKKKTG